MDRIKKYHKWLLALAFSVILIVIYKTFDNFYKVLDFAGSVWNSLTPFVVGFVFAYILNIPCKKIKASLDKSGKKFFQRFSGVISIVTVYVVMLSLIYIAIRSIAPALYRNIVDLYYNIPRYFDDAISSIVKWQAENGITVFEVDKMTATDTFNKILGKINITEFSKYAQGVVKITSGVINLFIGVIVSVYMLIDKDRIVTATKKLLNMIFKNKSETITKVVKKANSIFSKYIYCLLLDALFMTILSTLILSLLRVKYSLILGILIGICNLIPYFGAIISIASAVIITFFTGGLFKGIWAAIALLILQQVDGNFIGPKIMGQFLDISPLWIIFAVTMGGGLFGVGGMIISVPLLIVIRMLIREYMISRERGQVESGESGND